MSLLVFWNTAKMSTYFFLHKKMKKYFCYFILLFYFCSMWKEKLGNYLIDVSKYIFTGVVVASLFKDMEDNKWLIYGLGFTSSILALIVGLILTNKKKENK